MQTNYANIRRLIGDVVLASTGSFRRDAPVRPAGGPTIVEEELAEHHQVFVCKRQCPSGEPRRVDGTSAGREVVMRDNTIPLHDIRGGDEITQWISLFQ